MLLKPSALLNNWNRVIWIEKASSISEFNIYRYSYRLSLGSSKAGKTRVSILEYDIIVVFFQTQSAIF